MPKGRSKLTGVARYPSGRIKQPPELRVQLSQDPEEAIRLKAVFEEKLGRDGLMEILNGNACTEHEIRAYFGWKRDGRGLIEIIEELQLSQNFEEAERLQAVFESRIGREKLIALLSMSDEEWERISSNYL